MTNAYKYTKVATHKSQGDIEKILRRHGVDAVRWTSLTGELVIEFRRQLKDTPPLGYRVALKCPETQRAQYLRALFWFIKAKLEAVDFGIVSFEQAFLPNLLMGPDHTVGDEVIARLSERSIGRDVPLLPARAGQEAAR